MYKLYIFYQLNLEFEKNFVKDTDSIVIYSMKIRNGKCSSCKLNLLN